MLPEKCDYEIRMRQPGFEPGSPAWKAGIKALSSGHYTTDALVFQT